MPLQVIIVGAGIAGLCAATSLRQADHSVKIFEKSLFATEIGAALSLSPNGVRVLSSLGFSFERARARQLLLWESVHGNTLERISCLDFKDATEKYGAPFMAVHRVDLHNELLKLALEGDINPATLKLGAKVVNVDAEKGTLVLEDGSMHQADLIVASDGLHSVMRSAVLNRESAPSPTGLSAFRFLIPTRTLDADPAMRKLLKWKTQGATILADTTDVVNERHMVWYDCQGGDVQNFVGIHPTRSAAEGEQDLKSSMLQEFAHFKPDIVRIIEMADEVKCWPLSIHQPLLSWTYGRVILTGDAAHPMLPFGGQGSNQAIEDGGALGFLLVGVDSATDIPKRLELFEKVRRNRASRVQVLSKVRIGKEKEVEEELKLYAENADLVPGTFPERIAHDFSFDVLGKCSEALLQASRDMRRSQCMEEDIMIYGSDTLAPTGIAI